MSRSRLRVLVRSCLLVAFCGSVLTVAYGPIWGPVRDAAKVDAILSPDELRNPTLVDVVYRALAYKSLGETNTVYSALVVIVASASGLAWVMFENLIRVPDDRDR